MHHSGGGHGDEVPSGDDSPLRQGAGKSFRNPHRVRVDDGGGSEYVLDEWLGVLGFSRLGA